MTSLNSIQEFLGRKRFAVVGVSRNAKDFTRSLFRELRTRGYDAVPVNPGVSEIEGVRCFPGVAAIPEPVEAALLLTSPAVTDEVVKQCARSRRAAGLDVPGVGRRRGQPRRRAVLRRQRHSRHRRRMPLHVPGKRGVAAPPPWLLQETRRPLSALAKAGFD